ncbi:MAG: Pvc16 family protein [Candidatus Solibacter sp.]|nr:Pvc16 family protein [Candidatus Solibacter sp.]
MPVPVSSLSQICREVVTFVGAQLDATALSIRVLLGTPADAAKEDNTTHRLNLLFYRFEPSPVQAGLQPGDVWQLRLYCLITPFAVKEGLVGAGEMDLRLLGEVLRLFHEQPILAPATIDGQDVRLHAIYHPPDMAEINHLWTTQGGDLVYRPSLVYEFSVAPVVPKKPRVPSPLVGTAGIEVTPTMHMPAASDGAVFGSLMTARSVAAGEDWAPIICFVAGGVCAQSLSAALGSAGLTAPLQVWIAGRVGAAVWLRWDIWDATSGWRPSGTAVAAAAVTTAINPDDVATASLFAIPLPFTDHAGQAVLHAVRTYSRPTDDAVLTLRGNLLLVTLYRDV